MKICLNHKWNVLIHFIDLLTFLQDFEPNKVWFRRFLQNQTLYQNQQYPMNHISFDTLTLLFIKYFPILSPCINREKYWELRKYKLFNVVASMYFLIILFSKRVQLVINKEFFPKIDFSSLWFSWNLQWNWYY